MKCPRCQQEMEKSSYESVEIDHCAGCKGKWLDSGELSKIIEIKEESFENSLIHHTLQAAHSGFVIAEEESVELCPICSDRMGVINYQYKTGIFLDTCPKGHGIWLDVQELEQVQIYSERSDQDYTEKGDAWRKLAEESLRKHSEAATVERKQNMSKVYYAVDSLIRKIVDAVGQF
jgi:Zn-finger nucleic acid-binding protein